MSWSFVFGTDESMAWCVARWRSVHEDGKNSKRLYSHQSLCGLFPVNSLLLVLLTRLTVILTVHSCYILLSRCQGYRIATSISTSFKWYLRLGAYLASSSKTWVEGEAYLGLKPQFLSQFSQYLAFLLMSLLQEASGYMQTST